MMELIEAMEVPQTLSRIAAETGLTVPELATMIDDLGERGEILQTYAPDGSALYSRSER